MTEHVVEYRNEETQLWEPLTGFDDQGKPVEDESITINEVTGPRLADELKALHPEMEIEYHKIDITIGE